MLAIQHQILSDQVLGVRLCSSDKKQCMFGKEDIPVFGTFTGKGGWNWPGHEIISKS